MFFCPLSKFVFILCAQYFLLLALKVRKVIMPTGLIVSRSRAVVFLKGLVLTEMY